jgi:hypothetical protein
VAAQSQGAALLRRAYEDLGFVGDSLIPTSLLPRRGASPAEWRAVGEWLMLARRMGAERVFFVGDDPVVLFARLPAGAADGDIVAAYRRAWSLARPRCLFLATDDELRVYALSTPPVRSLGDIGQLQPLEIVTRAADVADRLASYHREYVEAGTLFEEASFREREGRADYQLLDDVRAATEALVHQGLDRPLAHQLIERVILIRYLEDRGVITRDYLIETAAPNRAWRTAIGVEPTTPQLGAHSSFVSCLSEKGLTFSVFRRLAHDFNGDLFVVSDTEEERISAEHLVLVQRLLTGEGLANQAPLFLWAYDFSVVPTSLISSMYEQFYHAGTQDDSGTHYTPPELVEYVLSETLTLDVLKRQPRVCDPACGSGIFLVEAFRRIVRHEMTSRSRRLTPGRLRTLLLERIAGVDINAEAIRLAAFSLYLAYLNYQSPQDIRTAGPLPPLIHRGGDPPKRTVLAVADTFFPTATEAEAKVGGDRDPLPWESQAFDVVVGNPPWDEPKDAASSAGDDWAERNSLAVGDRNPSQLFLWRALSFMRRDGVAALLVGAPAFHNSRRTSKLFRRQWLGVVEIESIVNFTPARTVFFSGGIAPFLMIKFHARSEAPATPLVYRTVRPSPALTATRSLAYARTDRRWVDQDALRHRDYLWKVYAWGSHHDDALMARLDAEKPLADFLPTDSSPGYGYQRGSGRPSERLSSLPSLKRFDPWGPLEPPWFEDPPTGVKRQPDERLYQGQRIVVARGVRTSFGPSARLERDDFSFRHTVYCLPLASLAPWKAKTMLGVMLSSLGRYRLFMMSGSWGVWHDSVVPDDILSLPMRLEAASDSAIRRIVRAVDRLPRAVAASHGENDLLTTTEPGRLPRVSEILGELDEGVFQLFDLTAAERDLIVDFHAYTLDLVSRKSRSTALSPLSLPDRAYGIFDDLRASDSHPLSRYLETFLASWNRELGPEGEFAWRVIVSPRAPMLAAIFETRAVADGAVAVPDDTADWRQLLERLGASLARPVTTTIQADGVLRSVSDTAIVVVKRNESRLWTASAAREDAEATMLQTMALRRS